MTPIGSFGWIDNAPPDIDTANLELDRSQIGAYVDAQVAVETARALAAEGASGVLNPKAAAYGAAGDVIESYGSITAGQNTLTAIGMTFTAGNVLAAYGGGFKYAIVAGAGVGGQVLFSRITGYVDSTHVTLAANASTTVTSVPAAFGTDDTTAIDAVGAAVGVKGVIGAPPGGYIYQGTGLALQYPRMVAPASQGGTTFYMPATTSLFVSKAGPAQLVGAHIENIETFGGYGLMNLTYTGQQSGVYSKRIINFFSRFYAGSAISSLASDDPDWTINGHVTSGRFFSVAIAGQTDQCEIDVNHYACQYGIKLGLGGSSARIAGSWVVNTGPTARVPIWIVPRSVLLNSGRGLYISRFRFGNEGQSVTDFRLLYADEDTATGTNFSNNTPKWTASTGFVSGHRMDDCEIIGAQAIPIVYSTTPNVIGCHYEGYLASTTPSYALQYLTPPSADRNTSRNTFRFEGDAGVDIAPLVISNDPSVRVDDPTQITQPLVQQYRGGGDVADYVNLLSGSITTFTLSGATASNVTDAVGGVDAREVVWGANSNSCYHAIITPTTGRPVWIECDLKQGAASPATQCMLYMQYTGPGVTHWRRTVNLQTTWQRYRFLWFPREHTTTNLLQFGQLTGMALGSVDIGRVRVYHASEPVNQDGWFVSGGVPVQASAPNYANTFGTGSDGAVTFDGTTTTLGLVPAANVYTLTRDIYCTSLTVNSGVTIATAGNRIFVQGAFANAGTIGIPGNSGTALGVAGTAGTSDGLNGGAAGGAGNTGAGTAGGAGGVANGSTAGAGSTGAAGGQGQLKFSSALLQTPAPVLAGVINWGGVQPVGGSAGGGGGSGDGTNKGGGGGAGGPAIAIFAKSFVNTGTINASGGNGGTPTTGNCGGGGYGGGGLILVYTLTAATMGTVNVAHGTGGSGVGTGAAASNNGGNGFALNFVLS